MNIAQRIRKGIRRILGSEEDRASLWSGLQGIKFEIGLVRQELGSLRTDLDAARVLAGRAMAGQIAIKGKLPDLQAAEFKVFSQFGDDGIIQYLIRHLAVEPSVFVEFGVGDYRESNTRFLLMNNNWRGLIMDGNAASVARIKQDPLCLFYGLTVGQEFITRENINDLLRKYGFTGPIGLLSVDIDGNDYWVWEAIDAVDPVMVVCEYNSVFGAHRAVTTPYDPAFVRRQAHFSNLYYGASLKALCLLASRKGYVFIGSNSSGNNAYFIKRERLEGLRELSAEEGWVDSRFRESVSPEGAFSLLTGKDRLAAISTCPVYDVEKDLIVPLGAKGKE
jgi:hypothetical protein